MSELPVIVIVGRPNVGKSSLFNRIIGRRAAIVEERPGVTRDRKEMDTEWLGRPFTIVDTGGWMPGGSDLDDKVSRQSEKAMEDADAVLMVVDITAGVTDDDDRFSEILRRMDVPTMLVANKVDNRGARIRHVGFSQPRSRRASSAVGGARPQHRRFP